MLSQNTAEWLELRKTKIGASDAPVIMGVSPWKTPYRLWEEKTGLVELTKPTEAMRRGHNLEELARQNLEKMTGLFFLDQVKFHPHHSWMMASLDAIDSSGQHIAEIKCPNRAEHETALSGRIPEKYFPQLQHQLEVCGLEESFYFSFDGTNGVIVKCHRDNKYIKKMLQIEEEFFECMQSFIPPEMTERDYNPKSDDLWLAASNEWLLVNSQLKTLEKREKELRESIVSMSRNQNSIGGGIRVTRVIRKGAIQYDAILELKEIDVEKYRKSPVESYRIASS